MPYCVHATVEIDALWWIYQTLLQIKWSMHITFVAQKVPLYSLHGTYLHCSKQISWHCNFIFVRSWRLKSCSLKNTIEFQGSRDNIFCSVWVKCDRKTIAFLSSSTLTYIMSELNVCYEAKRLCNLNRKHIFFKNRRINNQTYLPLHYCYERAFISLPSLIQK